MNKREYCLRLADIYATSRNVGKELIEVKFKLFDEEDPDKRSWYNSEVERLLQKKTEIEEARKDLEAEGYSDSE